jgi:hypothetical protein
MQQLVDEQFVLPENGAMLAVATTPGNLLDLVGAYTPVPVVKWIDRNAT